MDLRTVDYHTAGEPFRIVVSDVGEIAGPNVRGRRETDGYSTACGHGTIALGAWAVESGRVVGAHDGEVAVVIDVPSGRVSARVRCADGRVEGVAFLNVPASVTARGVDAGGVEVDVAWGGAFYAFVPASAFGLSVTPEDLPGLIAAGRSVKSALDGAPVRPGEHRFMLDPRDPLGTGFVLR